MTKHRTFTTYRPKLAQRLINAGHPAKIQPSVFGGNRISWTFTVSEALRTLVEDFYDEIGQTPPEV